MKEKYQEIMKEIKILERNFEIETGMLANTVIMDKKTFDECTEYLKSTIDIDSQPEVFGMKIHLKEEGKIEVGRMIEEGA